MNNQPVAWMLADKEAEHIRSIMAVQHDFVPQGCVEIPLYTHPVKEQEIKEAKYGITTKWDGITTYHETTEPIGKAQEK